MKKIYSKFLLSLLFCMIGVRAYAYDIEVKNADGVTIYYNYTSDGKELMVTYGVADSEWNYRGTVNIPEEVSFMGRTRKVTSIGNKAFSDCIYLTSVTIPNCVTSIGNGAFSGCVGLKSIIIPNGVTSIGDNAFSDCTLTSIVIPNSVATIGDHAFYFCTCLESITIGNSVTIIGEWAFSNCSALKTITIPNSVTLLSEYAFRGCSNLTSIELGNSLTTIGYGAFDGCSSLTSIIIPKSVTNIGAIIAWLPYSTNSNPFTSCISLTSVIVESGNPVFDSREGCNAIIETKKNSILTGCMNTKIPDSVTSIGSQAFFGCTGITSITIPNGVSSINNGAFIYCSNLTSITIPNSVTEIAESAFYGGDLSTVVTQIKNPFIIVGKNNGVKSTFSLNTFNNATLYVPVGTMDKYKSTEGWKDFVFIEEGQPENQEPPSGVIAVENADGVTVYYNYINDGKELEVTCKSLGEASYSGVVNIPENVTYEGKTLQVTSINDQAFALCYDLVSVTIPNTIANIGQMAFAGCMGLTSVNIPQSVTSIGDAAFTMCIGLTSIKVDAGNSIFDSRDNCNAIIKTATNTLIAGCKNSVIPNGVSSIGIGTFYLYEDMTSVTIPRSVTSIGSLAFGKCSGLKNVYCYAESVPTTLGNVFDETPINEATLHVPQASISAYKAVSPWNGFKEIVALTEQEMGLLRTSVDEHEYSEWYQLNGQKSSIPKRGLNIIRMNNGKIKKVVVK